MSRMLVAVRNGAEAAAAVAGGADRLVFKARTEMAFAEVAAARGRCPVSLWIDDAGPAWAALCDRCGADEVYAAPALLGVPAAMIGRVAVVPAAERDDRRFADLARAGFAGVALRGDGGPRRLLQVVTLVDLQGQVEAARQVGLSVVIAGQVEPPDVPRLLALAPDAILLDEVVRRGGREVAALDPARLALLRDLVPRQGGAHPAPVDGPGRDVIFVRDWTVAIHVGAYSHEHAAQRVRFTVEAEVVPARARAADLRDVVSYDLITDAIARATAGHVDLVETLAADVASSVLAHPRVVAVEVTVEKLDLGPGRVGCRLRRARRGEA